MLEYKVNVCEHRWTKRQYRVCFRHTLNSWETEQRQLPMRAAGQFVTGRPGCLGVAYPQMKLGTVCLRDTGWGHASPQHWSLIRMAGVS